MRDRGRKGGQKKTWREGEKIANLRRKEMTEGKQRKQRSSNGKVPVMKTEEKTKKKKSLQG